MTPFDMKTYIFENIKVRFPIGGGNVTIGGHEFYVDFLIHVEDMGLMRRLGSICRKFKRKYQVQWSC